MTNDEFKHYYNSPTKTIRAALDHARTLFCVSTCNSQCPHNCTLHALPNTLKDSYQILNNQINPRIRQQHTYPPPIIPLDHPKSPLYVQNNHILYPIHSIIKDRSHTYHDKIISQNTTHHIYANGEPQTT